MTVRRPGLEEPQAPPCRIGTAGWSIPRADHEAFLGGGSQLERYGSRFTACEINSSFHRAHKASTYERWAGSVPDAFHFAVKIPKAITHERRLADASDLLDRFWAEVQGLGPKLGPLLLQLPPSLAFDAPVVTSFLLELRNRAKGPIVCEPRHASWFAANADDLLNDFRISRVAADPARAPGAAEPGGWRGLSYWRLHGTPRIYYSSYDTAALDAISRRLKEEKAAGVPSWCIFDNTASGAAMRDALALHGLMESRP